MGNDMAMMKNDPIYCVGKMLRLANQAQRDHYLAMGCHVESLPKHWIGERYLNRLHQVIPISPIGKPTSPKRFIDGLALFFKDFARFNDCSTPEYSRLMNIVGESLADNTYMLPENAVILLNLGYCERG
jgi:hypothetical protein